MIDPSIIAIDLDYLVKDHPEIVQRLANQITILKTLADRHSHARGFPIGGFTQKTLNLTNPPE